MAKAGLLFVGTSDGVVLFSNPGAVGRWLRVGHALREMQVQAVWARPDNPQHVLAVCGPAGVWRSADGGQSWEQALTISAGAAASPGGPVSLAALAGKEPVLLLASDGGIARSADDGATWSAAEPEAPWAGEVRTITPASYHIDTAFAGTSAGQVFISVDRGRTWQLIKDGLPPISAIAAARLV